MITKPWIFYVVLAWQAVPLGPVEQKTLVLQFEHLAECISIAEQVDDQVKAARSIFWTKQITCVPCEELYGKDRCPRMTVKKK